MNDEEVAFKVVRLYFEEIARLGFKRQLDLDQIINAYFYALKKLGNKEAAMAEAMKKIMSDEKTKSEMVRTTTTTETNAVEPKKEVFREVIETKESN
ncbi:MAG: hypothetical protein HOE11_04120 [Candidatus Diapherotrites archaeon]|jgi:hypothetical protein|nr:hypothetical protein [Candidatus Diapherotrites archaeon]MBT4597039.1 hypothetical protein [Candidatus Diapherotrites archaeon]